MPAFLPSCTPALFVFVWRRMSTGARERPMPNCTMPVLIKPLLPPSSRNVLPNTRASQYLRTNSLCRNFSGSLPISAVICFLSRPRCSRIQYRSASARNCSGSDLKNGVSWSSSRSRSLRLNETGEISPQPFGRCRGSLSRSGSPFGLELTTSMTRSPVARLISLSMLFFLLIFIQIRFCFFLL